MKAEDAKALPKGSWSRWETYLLIWAENQIYKNILGQAFRREK